MDKHTGGGETRFGSDRGRGEGGASDLHLGGPRDGCSLREVARRLQATGSADQDRSLPLGLRDDQGAMVRNSTYKGHAFFLAKDGPARRDRVYVPAGAHNRRSPRPPARSTSNPPRNTLGLL